MCVTPSGVPRADDRRYLSGWISQRGHGLLRKRADEEADGNLSEIMRRMLKYASVYMPKGWK